MKITFIAVCASIAVQPAFAEDKAKGHKAGAIVVHARTPAAKPSDGAKASPPKQPWVGYTVTISPSEQHVIRAYVHNCLEGSKGRKPNGLPPGLKKKLGGIADLPPDWQKRCVRGEVLPPEVHRHCHSLPDEVILKLPHPPPGTVILAIEGKVLRLAYPTYEILDVFNLQ